MTAADDSKRSNHDMAEDRDELNGEVATADGIEPLNIAEDSLNGFGSASITGTSDDEERQKEDDYDDIDQAITEANEIDMRLHASTTATDSENGNGKAKHTSQTLKLTSEDIKFVLDTMGKEAPHDLVSLKQLFYGMASAFTKTPIHHSVTSRKTGAGKTHDLTLVADYFPRKHVIALAGMSDKALFHRRGVDVIVDEDTGKTMAVQPVIDDLKGKIDDLEEKNAKENKKEIQKLKAEIQELNDKSQKLIELDNTIFLFLDTAQEGLFNTLMSLISQDTNDQLYEFTDKSGVGKLGSKVNRLRGTPTIFNTQVIDDTRQLRYQEKNRRLIHVILDTSSKKIHTAMGLIGRRYGLIDEQYDEQVVSSADKEHAREIVSIMVKKLMEHSKLFGPKKSGVKISFFDSIVHGIHKGKESEEWAMTVMDRTMRYLAIVTKVNMDSRPKIIDTKTGKFYPISTFEDLKETFQLMRMASSMVRPYIANWYNVVFLPSFKELPDEPNKLTKEIMKDGEKDEIVILRENEVGLTTKELAKKTYEIMKISVNPEQVREQYLYPLREMGIISMTRSVINGRENLCSPVEGSIFSLFDDDSDDDARLKIFDYRLYPSKNLLEQEFRTMCGLAASQGEKNDKNNFERYRIEDADGTEITVSELIDNYLSDPETCFIKAYPELNQQERAESDPEAEGKNENENH